MLDVGNDRYQHAQINLHYNNSELGQESEKRMLASTGCH